MRFHGLYKKTLYQLLFAAAILTALILSALTGWFLNRQAKSDYTHYLEQSVQAQQSNASVAASTIMKTIHDCTGGTEISRWIDAATLPEFYFYAIQASRKLQEATTDMLLVEYQCAVTPLDPPSFQGKEIDMVLLQNSSMSSGQFCEIQGIAEETYRQIQEYFRQNDAPLVWPNYSAENGELSSLYYIIKSRGSRNPYLFFVMIPSKTLLNYPMADSFIVYNQNGSLAYSNQALKADKEISQLYEELLHQKDYTSYEHPKKVGNHYLMVTGIAPFQWLIALQCPLSTISVGNLMKFGAVVFLILTVFLLFSYCLVEKLYAPMEALLETTPLSELQDNQVNEFEIIRKNMERITELGNRLRETMRINDSLMSIQSYKELLFCQKPTQKLLDQFEASDADYCVAIGETLCPGDEYAFQPTAIQKGIAYDATEGREDLFYINLDYNRYALILRTSSLDVAKNFLISLLRRTESDEDSTDYDYRIVLSDIHKGLDQLHVCYQEALKILDFSSLHSKSRLITYQDIAALDASMYSYPLKTENRLIQCVLDGKQEAIQIFENVIRENIRDKDLSKENLQNLMYAFIGTISRIFQELKTTPEELIGKKVDYKYLYNHWNDSTVMMLLRDILLAVIDAIQQRESSRDQELLQKMLGYIYKNYGDDIMLNDLADYLNISPKYCGILFKQLSDNNFKDFLNRYRIERSKEILEQNPSIKIVDLSTMVGFNSSNSFIRVFNKYVGITPGAYLERIKEGKKIL